MGNWWRQTEIRFTGYALLLTLSLLVYLHAKAWQPDTDYDNDGPYHVAMADLFGKAALGKTFPMSHKPLSMQEAARVALTEAK